MSTPRSKTRISKRTVDGLRPESGPRILWDNALSGFGVRCHPSGAKVYLVKYQIGSQQRWYRIGNHSEALTADIARARAVWVIREVIHGHDPQEQKTKARQAQTLSEYSKRYLKDHAEARLKPRSVQTVAWLINKVIIPGLGSKRVDTLTHTDVTRWHEAGRDHPVRANRALVLLHHMMRMAERWSMRPRNSNPCIDVEKFKERPRERYLTFDELKTLSATLNKAEQLGSEPSSALRAIRLLVLTGGRLGEILGLRWEWIDWEQSCIRFPDSKTGSKITPLGRAALRLLAECRREAGWVIPGARRDAPLVGINHIWGRIRKEAGISDVRLHDLRHTYATVGLNLGLSLPLIGGVLGHASPATTSRYAHLQISPARAAADTMSDAISAAMIGHESPKHQPRKRRLRSTPDDSAANA